MGKLKYIFTSLGFVFGLSAIAFGIWLWTLNSEVAFRLESKKFLPPTEYYSAPIAVAQKMHFSLENIQKILQERNYRQRNEEDKLFPGDFAQFKVDICQKQVPEPLPSDSEICLLFSPRDLGDTSSPFKSNLNLIIWNKLGDIVEVRSGNPLLKTEKIEFEPLLFAQYINGEPISQKPLSLGEMPTTCLNAVLAIEDSGFLEHYGVSLSGIARAALKNTFGTGIRQGGSTITQQLVKNYFLNSERTLKRKITEFFMSLILENHASKDEILETYLNIIYLGQNGPFQIRGFGAAANYYFKKPIQDLQISDCALLAAIVNSPGLFDPFHKPENALKRKKMVLERMKSLEFISAKEYELALQEPLPRSSQPAIFETAPYYLNAANHQLRQMGINPEGLKIFTGLDIEAQQKAQESVRTNLTKLETENKKLAERKSKGQNLEGILLSANNQTGIIDAVVGGRSFKLTQFNRASEGHRQVGSIMKPFVFLAALDIGQSDKKRFDPLTPLLDEKFSYKFDRQTWSPDNYGKKYYGTVPAYFALKNSLNAATASLGIEAGLERVVRMGKFAGINSKLDALPSLTLGAAELYPTEVLEAYVFLARLGNHIPLSFVRSVVTQDGKSLFEFHPLAEQRVDPGTTAELVSMMKQTVLTGTAKSLASRGFNRPAAGKTGTTSDYKDAWFAGFTPQQTTVTWVGYDDNTPHGLTGASGPLPIWSDYMLGATQKYAPDDFQWPESTEIISWREKLEKEEITVNLVFKKGVPRSQ